MLLAVVSRSAAIAIREVRSGLRSEAAKGGGAVLAVFWCTSLLPSTVLVGAEVLSGSEGEASDERETKEAKRTIAGSKGVDRKIAVMQSNAE